MKSRENSERGRVKVRFLEIEADGGTSAILEGLRTVAAAFGKDTTKTVNGQPASKLMSQANSARTLTPKNGELFEEITGSALPAEEDATLVESESLEPVETPKSKIKRKLPSAKLLPEIDIARGDPNLRSFVEAKQPRTDLERYMVSAAWLRKEYGLAGISIDHIHTCFMGMGWKPPQDLGAPFRKMKNKYFNKNGNEWELHSIAESLVGRLPQRD